MISEVGEKYVREEPLHTPLYAWDTTKYRHNKTLSFTVQRTLKFQAPTMVDTSTTRNVIIFKIFCKLGFTKVISGTRGIIVICNMIDEDGNSFRALKFDRRERVM